MTDDEATMACDMAVVVEQWHPDSDIAQLKAELVSLLAALQMAEAEIAALRRQLQPAEPAPRAFSIPRPDRNPMVGWDR